MATLYFAIIGFVIIVADTILLFAKFSQKDKMVWFHGGYFIGFFICGMVAVTNINYTNYMKSLNALNPTSPTCLSMPIPLECSFSSYYLSYQSKLTTFFIVYVIFFVAYAALYHFTVVKLAEPTLNHQ